MGGATPVGSVFLAPSPVTAMGWPLIDRGLTCLFGLGLALAAVGGGEALARVAHELPPPRVQGLRRTGLFTLFFALFTTTLGTFLFVLLVPAVEQSAWINAPLAGLAQHLSAPSWVRDLVALALVGAALLMLAPAAHAALGDAEQMLQRLSAAGTLPAGLASLHRRLGTPARAIDVSVAAAILMVLVSSGRVTWLARAYAIAIVATVVLEVAALVRLRRRGAGALSFKAPMNVHLAGYEVPIGLVGPALVLVAVGLAMVGIGDAASIAAAALLVGLVLLFTAAGRDVAPPEAVEGPDGFDLLPSAELSLDQIDARPGNALVLVAQPALARPRGWCAAGAGRSRHRRDDRAPARHRCRRGCLGRHHTHASRTAIAVGGRGPRRPARPVRPPAHRAGPQRLRRHRGDDPCACARPTSTSANRRRSRRAEQARLLGDAWERADKPEHLEVRLVIHHRTGRADAYQLGAHPPSLAPSDLDLIHRVWLDASQAVGPHVHHHDVVRAALTQMEQQLNGPNRDEALAVIRGVARPAEELAAVVRARDFARLRDLVRNRHASDLAPILTDLGLEDQVVVFRVLPRKDAAAVFEYLSHEAQDALLKAMAQEDVARSSTTWRRTIGPCSSRSCRPRRRASC